MGCFPCFSSQKSKKAINRDENNSSSSDNRTPLRSSDIKKHNSTADTKGNNVENGKIDSQIFTFRELATATKNFRQECLLGEGGFGRVFKATLQPSGQVVAVKQLDRNGLQGNKEFLGEVRALSLLNHPNLVKFNGYCADGDQRLLVYEYMSAGSLEDCILDTRKNQKPLDWFIRIKIASGVAKGLEYLHDKADPPIIYRDLKSSNILLDEDFNPKLSDFGLAKMSPAGDKSPLPSRVMGTYGYSAPEYTRTGQLTLKSDIYSFGVILLELITGRRAIDTTKPNNEQNLVTWAQPLFRDPKKFPDMADPLLERRFPEKDLNQAVAIAAMCLQEEAEVRPLIGDVVTALSFLSTTPDENLLPLPIPTPPEVKTTEAKLDSDKDQGDEDTTDSSDNEAWKTAKDHESSEDKDETSANLTSPRNHESDTSDEDEDDEEDEDKAGYVQKQHLTENGGKETEHKRVAFKDDLHPNLSRKSSSSSSSDGGSSSNRRSSNASEDGRMISQENSRKWGDLSAASSNGSSRKSVESDGVSSGQEHIEASEDVNIVSLDHNSSRGSHSDDESVHSNHNSSEIFKAGNYSSESEGSQL